MVIWCYRLFHGWQMHKGASNSVHGDPKEECLCLICVVGVLNGMSALQKVLFGQSLQNLYCKVTFHATECPRHGKSIKVHAILSLVTLKKIVYALDVWWK